MNRLDTQRPEINNIASNPLTCIYLSLKMSKSASLQFKITRHLNETLRSFRHLAGVNKRSVRACVCVSVYSACCCCCCFGKSSRLPRRRLFRRIKVETCNVVLNLSSIQLVRGRQRRRRWSGFHVKRSFYRVVAVEVIVVKDFRWRSELKHLGKIRKRSWHHVARQRSCLGPGYVAGRRQTRLRAAGSR